MSNFLNDMWEVTGTDIESFEEELKNIGRKTLVEEVKMDEVYFLSVSDFGSGYTAVPLQANSIWRKTKSSLLLKRYDVDKDSYLRRGYEENTINEAFANGLFIVTSKKRPSQNKIKEMIENGSYIPVSQKAMGTISNRISKRGNGFLSDDLIRDLAIAKKFDKPIPVSVVSRLDPEKNVKKIFAVMSKKYSAIPQNMILEILKKIEEKGEKDFGKAECVGWSINHSLTRIYVEFPGCGKEFMEMYGYPDEIIPGIMVETSDIGDCSLRVRGYYRDDVTKAIFYLEDECVQMHIGDIDTDEILEMVKTNIFAKLTWYPERLAELMEIDIVDDSMKPAVKKRILSSLYRKISREIGLVKAITKAKEKVLMEQLIDSINTDLSYTAYDIAITFLTLASYVETENKGVIEAIAKTAPAVMKFKFVEEEEDLLVV
jgi:hypothetical protein